MDLQAIIVRNPPGYRAALIGFIAACFLLVLAGCEEPTPALGDPPVAPCNLFYVEELSIPDGTEVEAGTPFVKRWRITNHGTCWWDQRYFVAFRTGDRMGARDVIYWVGDLVRPGESFVITLNLVAPYVPGRYRGEFRFMIAIPGPEPDYAPYDYDSGRMHVEIVVPEFRITALRTWAEEEVAYVGACPHTLQIRSSMTAIGSGYAQLVTFPRELFPWVTSVHMDTGTIDGTTYMPISTSTTGEYYIQVLTPNEIVSNRIPFSVRCVSPAPPPPPSTGPAACQPPPDGCPEQPGAPRQCWDPATCTCAHCP